MSDTEQILYVRIGDLWHCKECDKDLLGFWALAKHDWRNHYFQRIVGRIRHYLSTDVD